MVSTASINTPIDNAQSKQKVFPEMFTKCNQSTVPRSCCFSKPERLENLIFSELIDLNWKLLWILVATLAMRRM